MNIVGVLLAAGAGSRMGRPKALLRDADGRPFLNAATAALLDGGCRSVVVVLGASAEVAAQLVEPRPEVTVVIAEDWRSGLSASLQRGLGAAADADVVLIHLADLPDVGTEVVRRVLADVDPRVLARAAYAGRPGHPVAVGSTHRQALMSSLSGDVGAGPYMTSHGADLIECGDLATGRDVDLPQDLERLPPVFESPLSQNGTRLY